MSAIHPTQAAPMRFLRDVAVNIVANLVAAAVIYLGGAGIGVFPRYRVAILTSAAFVFLVILTTVMVWANQARARGAVRLANFLNVVLTLVMLGFFAAVVGIDMVDGPINWASAVPAFIVTVLFAVLLIRDQRSFARRIAGLARQIENGTKEEVLNIGRRERGTGIVAVCVTAVPLVGVATYTLVVHTSRTTLTVLAVSILGWAAVVIDAALVLGYIEKLVQARTDDL